MAFLSDKINDLLESREFYELMQDYRHAPVAPQSEVVAKFEAVKKFLQDELDAAVGASPPPFLNEGTPSEKEQRAAMSRYFNDVMWDVWNRGGNPDLVDRDRVWQHEADGLSEEGDGE